ncbi:MAG: DUF58 domain-containing protein [Spirochaetales bacterium]
MIAGAALVLAGLAVPWPLVRWSLVLVGLFVAASRAWALLLSTSLRVKAEFPTERSFSGQVLEVRYRLENRGPLASGVVHLADFAGNLEILGSARHFVSPGPLGVRRFGYRLKPNARGLVELGPFEVSASDPAGFFPFRNVQKGDQRRLVVYPPLRPGTDLSDDGLPPGSRQRDHYWEEDNTRFRAYREFREGDELSRLVASASSRLQMPVVRTFDRTRAYPVLVFLDLRLHRYPLKQRWAVVERVVETAAGMLWAALSRGETAWMSAIGHRATDDIAGGAERWGPGNDPASAQGFLEALAVIRPWEGTPALDWDEAAWWGSLPAPPLQVFRLGPRPQQIGAATDESADWKRRWKVTDVWL